MKMKFLIKWPNHATAVAAGLLKLYKENFKTDFELSINGSYIKAHHLILAMFCSRVKSEDKSTLILGDQPSLSVEDVHELLDFIYTGELNVEESRLVSLKQLCHLIGFKDLFNIIDGFLNRRNQAAPLPTRSIESTQRIASSNNEVEKIEVIKKCGKKKMVNESNSKQEIDKSDENSIFDSKDEEQEPELQSDSNDVGDQELEPQSDSDDVEERELEPHSSSQSIDESGSRKPKYACKLCSYTNNFKNSNYIALHMITKHRVDLEGNPAIKNFLCHLCPKTFYAKEYLRKHIFTVHSEKRFVCEQCGIKFHTKHHLQVHTWGKHSKIKRYICETCGKGFGFINNLRAHYNTHKPNIVTCNMCGDSVTKGCLQKHMINKHSTGPKTHKCPFCSFGTWNNWNLKTHLKNVHKVAVGVQETFCEN